MKIYSITSQKQISEKYKLSEYIPDKIKDLVITNVQIPEYNELIGTIYCFVNTINAKVYIGQTYTKYYERFGKHYVDTFTKQDDLYFHKAIRKYG
ncbi:MAG: hypothetical protein J6P12_09685 [Methanobrevibacter sp.]|nr:hypothetical protein [Methanobrevibacter sp.]